MFRVGGGSGAGSERIRAAVSGRVRRTVEVSRVAGRENDGAGRVGANRWSGHSAEAKSVFREETHGQEEVRSRAGLCLRGEGAGTPSGQAVSCRRYYLGRVVCLGR